MDSLTISRELLQAQILVELMGNAVKDELVLKGGLAMRAVHGSMRYTKDIDLDAVTEASDERIRGLIRRSLDSVLRRTKFLEEHVVTEPKQTETTLRWKVNGRVPGTTRPVNLTIEVSRRPWPAHFNATELELSPNFAGGGAKGEIRVLDSRALAVCKVLALTDARREAPRDLYDLSILIEDETLDAAPLLSEQDPARLQQGLDELWNKVETMDYVRFQEEVAPYLPPASSALITPEIYDEMRASVGVRVEEWLTRAQSLQSPPSDIDETPNSTDS
jgi:predicted nucleotidyltransferase component of viral defense system